MLAPICAVASRPPAIVQAILSIGFSPGSHLDTALENTEVGVLSNDKGIVATYTIDNAKYKLLPADGIGVTVKVLVSAAGEGNFTAGVPESLGTVTADPGNGTAAYEQAKSVTVLGELDDLPIAIVTTTETSGNNKTNEIAQFGLTLAAGAMAGRSYLKVYEADENNEPTDPLAAYWFDLPTIVGGEWRFCWGGFIIPSLMANATVKHVIAATNDAPPTADPITAAQILATSARVVDEVDIGGTVYAFDTDDALAAGETPSKTNYSCVQAAGNSHRTILGLAGPPKNSGTAHASGDGLRVKVFEVRAFKVGAGAVDGENPITAVQMRTMMANGDTERVTPANYYFGMRTRRATSLGDGTLIEANTQDADGNEFGHEFPRSAPAETLTLVASSFPYESSTAVTYASGTSVTVAGNVTATFPVNRRVRAVGTSTGTIYGRVATSSYSAPNTTLTFVWDSGSLSNEAITLSRASNGAYATLLPQLQTSGVWDADIKGAFLSTADFKAQVCERVSDTHVRVRFYEPNFPAGAGSYSSGNWSIEGIGLGYLSDRAPNGDIWFGNAPSNITVVGDVDNAANPSGRGVLDYLASTGAIPNLQLAYADAVNSTTKLDAMKTAGVHRPMTVTGIGQFYVGDVRADIGGTGWNENIGVIPEYMVHALAKYDAAGRRRIFENVAHMSIHRTCPPRLSGSPTNGELGVIPRADGGKNYTLDSRFTAHSTSFIQQPTYGLSPFDNNKAHTPHVFYVAHLLQPTLYTMMRIQAWELDSNWMNLNPGYNGFGIDLTILGDATLAKAEFMGSSTERQKAHTLTDLTQARFATPDGISAKLSAPASYYDTRLAKTWAAGYGYGPNDVKSYGHGTPPDATPRWNGPNFGFSIQSVSPGTEAAIAPWMHSFFLFQLGHAREKGLLDANGIALQEWHLDGMLEKFADDTAVVKEAMARGYWLYAMDGSLYTDYPENWAALWMRHVNIAPITGAPVNGHHRTFASGNVTLSDNTVGTDRIATLPADKMSGGGNLHIGGFVAYNGTGASGRGRIKNVSLDGLELIIDIDIAFPSTTLTGSLFRIPGPHRLDYAGEYDTIAAISSSSDYAQFAVNALRINRPFFPAKEAAVDAAIAVFTGLTGYEELRKNYYTAPRGG